MADQDPAAVFPRGDENATRGFYIRTGKESRKHGIGRVCAHSECDSILSRYNSEPTCYLHTGYRRLSIRGRKERT
ncbi:MAG: hypothetical protein MUP13_03410 [Thermoanaerobaculales bacterium]|nr:hypothetical protein [Thermoanaerobaculales bacterium]